MPEASWSSLRPQTPRELQRKLEMDRIGHAYLAWRDAEGELRLTGLAAGRERFVLGRVATADISLTWDRCVSRVHAELVLVAGTWGICDDGMSMNGTYINTARLAGRQILESGDRIRVGDTVLLFQQPVVHHAASTTPPASPDPLQHVTSAQLRVLSALVASAELRAGWPASNTELAAQLSLDENTIKSHLGALYRHFRLEGLPNAQKRSRLVQLAAHLGVGKRAAEIGAAAADNVAHIHPRG